MCVCVLICYESNIVGDAGLAFCINYNLSPSDLVSSWDVFSLNR